MPLPPGFTEEAPTTQGPPAGFQEDNSADWGGVVKAAMNEARMGNGSKMRALMTDPVTQAKVLPYLTAAVGTEFGGPTAAWGVGRGLSDAALASYGKPEEIPSLKQHAIEGAGALASEAIPFIQKFKAGKAIGKAEDTAGVVARGAPKAVTPGSVGQTLTDLESQIDAGTINTAQGARDAKEIVDQIYGNPRIYEKSPGINVQAARVSAKVQSLLNGQVPGRGGPASVIAEKSVIPNAIGNITRKLSPRHLPVWAQAAGGTAASLLGLDALKNALGGGR